MTAAYPPRRRGRLARSLVFLDDFASWLLFGRETWLVALLKGVPLFLFLYFMFFYVPNFIFWLVTLPRPFEPFFDFGIGFSPDVGYAVGNGIGLGNLTLVVVVALWAQASRGRRGPSWTFIRLFVLANYLLTGLVIIPYMCFSLAGGRLIRFEAPTAQLADIPSFALTALAFATLVAGIAVAALVYMYFEYRRITRQDAALAGRAARAYSAPGAG
jgi:hypothetical protein